MATKNKKAGHSKKQHQSKRKFYRTVFQVEVLSEEPYPEQAHLEDIAQDIQLGDCSGVASVIVSNEIKSGKEIVKLLKAQGSDTEFFKLDDEGNDLED